MADINGQLEVTFESGVTLDAATILINKTHDLDGFIGADSGGVIVGVASVPPGDEATWAATLTADSDITSATRITRRGYTMKHAVGEVVVVFSDGTEEEDVSRILEEVGATAKKTWPSKRGLRAIASVPPGEETPWAKKISELSSVASTYLD